MKYEIVYSCGHKGSINLSGSTEEIDKKLELYHEIAVCPACYRRGELAEKLGKQQKMNSIKCPTTPDIIGWKKWNRKFYGHPGDWRIYLDWKRTMISNSEKDDLEKYLKDLEDYEAELAELQIKEAYYERN